MGDSSFKEMPWLAQLVSGRHEEEKRRNQPAHELLAGVPCLRCGSGCKGGLDLHFWRKLCKNCGCKFEDHRIKVDESVHNQIVQSLFIASDGTKTQPKRRNTLAVSAPRGVQQDTKHSPFRGRSLSEDNRTNPLLRKKENVAHKSVERSRQQMMKQLPPQDFDPYYCHNLTQAERLSLEKFSEKSRKNAAGKGKRRENTGPDPWVCHGCKRGIPSHSDGILAEKAGPLNTWHQQCFVCSVCNEELVDLIYFVDRGKLYCGRHYAELYKARCKGCDELIFSSEYTQAEGHYWHRRHFVCYSCERDLGGLSYISHKGQPYCLTCYNVQLANKCATCHEPIKAGVPRISHQGLHWHASRKCFFCRLCNINLTDCAYYISNGKVYCSFKCASYV